MKWFLWSVLILGHSLAEAQLVPMAFFKRAASSPPVPRLIANAYFSSWSGTTYESSASMSTSGFAISTSGVNNGDLLIVVATVDNGASDGSVWPNPIFTGFTQLGRAYFGVDGSSYVVAWKIANNEPATYSNTYGSGIISASATITLIAVSGASQTAPINAYSITSSNSNSTTTVTGSASTTSTVANTALLYFAGVDWYSTPGTTTFTTPTGFTNLTKIGDRGTSAFDWTTQQLAYKTQATAGATGTISGTQKATSNSGAPWAGVIAIAPP